MKKFYDFYQKAKRNTGNIITTSLIAGFLGLTLDSILNTKTGSFIDNQTGKKFSYSLYNKSLHMWPEDSHPVFAIKIRDLNKDGNIDHVGSITYPRMPFELNIINKNNKKEYQRLYDLALNMEE